MYIDLKDKLTSKIDKIDITVLKRYDTNGNTYFTLNDSNYYPKRFNLNELIGEELSKKIHLRTVEFELFEKANTEIIIASKSFLNKQSIYYYFEHIGNANLKTLEILEKNCLDKENYIQFLNNIFKMFAVDIYMGQSDRCFVNVQLEEYDSGYLDLAPIYDYSNSDWDENIYYDNPFYYFENEDDYTKLFTAYPNSLEAIKKIKEVNLKKILTNIQEKKGIKIPQEVIDIYLKREEISQKKLEKIIK